MSTDIERCIQACFVGAEHFTTEQCDLARDLIVKGPPAWKCVVMQLPEGSSWSADDETISRDGVTVGLVSVSATDPRYVARLRPLGGSGSGYRRVAR
jgi:hypothetical protein